jgi:citrate synthase
VLLGTSQECAELLAAGVGRSVRSGTSLAHVADQIADEVHRSGGRLPGFGHPVHKPLDPRAERILELANEHQVDGPHLELARCLRSSVTRAWGKPLTMNVSMPIAAVLLDVGFEIEAVKAIPILARTAGLLAHLAEERERPIGFLLAGYAEDAVSYEPVDHEAELGPAEIE